MQKLGSSVVASLTVIVLAARPVQVYKTRVWWYQRIKSEWYEKYSEMKTNYIQLLSWLCKTSAVRLRASWPPVPPEILGCIGASMPALCSGGWFSSGSLKKWYSKTHVIWFQLRHSSLWSSSSYVPTGAGTSFPMCQMVIVPQFESHEKPLVSKEQEKQFEAVPWPDALSICQAFHGTRVHCEGLCRTCDRPRLREKKWDNLPPGPQRVRETHLEIWQCIYSKIDCNICIYIYQNEARSTATIVSVRWTDTTEGNIGTHKLSGSGKKNHHPISGCHAMAGLKRCCFPSLKPRATWR